MLGLLLTLPCAASAQVTVPPDQEIPGVPGRPRERQTITLRTGRSPTASPGDHANIVPEFHTVTSGDTLWDISGYYFTNPWQWPQLWARNPQITNPHWIFPGDRVRLLMPGEATAPAVAARPSTRLGNRLALPAARYPRGTVFLREAAWATSEQIATSGAIVGAPEDAMLLSEGDQCYIEFDRRAPNVGETYVIYSEGQPARGGDRNSGRVVRVLGTVIVDAWDRDRHVATARITESLESIERGERVAFIQRQFLPVPPRPNDRDVVGHVVAMPFPNIIAGGQQVVIVDRGESDGIQLGNRFFLTERGDPWFNNSQGSIGSTLRLGLDRDGDGVVDQPPDNRVRNGNELPAEVWGEMMVVAVHPQSAVCLVTMSTHEIEIGNLVTARRGY